jgi:hypothetical protein
VIDSIWLRRVIAYSEADTGGYDADHLTLLLEDQTEVLPYLILHARGFIQWPKSRVALAKAAANAPRARRGDAISAEPQLSEFRTELYEGIRQALAASAANRVPPAKPLSAAKPTGASKPKATPEAAELTTKGKRQARVQPEAEIKMELEPEPDSEPEVAPVTADLPCSADELSGLIKRIRFDEARGADSPSMFISR